MQRTLEVIFDSAFIKIAMTLLVYCVYAVIIGISLTPSIYLLAWTGKSLMTVMTLGSVALFSIACGLALFLYFVVGALVMSAAIRIISAGIKPGRYPIRSLTMVRWLLYSGIYQLAGTTILSHIPMGFLGTLFFRIVGAKIGKNVVINTWHLNDAFMLDIGDNVVIGGQTDISCHTFENGRLLLQPVKIGSDTLVGQQCYISPGVNIGKGCVIGQYALVRKNHAVPDRSVISALAGLPIRTVARLEKAESSRPRLEVSVPRLAKAA